MNKIDREITALKKQLVENQKIFGTRCDLRRRRDGYYRDAQITITKVITTSGHRPDRTSLPTRSSGRRHSIASPMELKELDDHLYDRSLPSNHVEYNVGKNYINTQRHAPPSVPLPNDQRLPETNPSTSHRKQRRHSIASPTDCLGYNTPKTPTQTKLSATDLATIRVGRSVTSFSNKNRTSSFDNPLRNQDHQQSTQQLTTSRSRNVTQRSSVTWVNSVDDSTKVQRGNTRANTDKLASSPPDINNNKRLFQRRHSLPNTALLPHNEQTTLFKTGNRQEILTAKLPTRISSARTRINSTHRDRQTRRPTPVEEKHEIDDNVEKQDDEEDDDNQDDNETVNKEDDECKGDDDSHPPQELRDIPKITLEEKIERFFAGAVDSFPQAPDHFQEVLDQFKNKSDEQPQSKKQD